jgi:NitT/TauT family transport system permease protein
MADIARNDVRTASASASAPSPTETVANPVPFRGGGFQPRSIRFAGLIAFVVIIALWQLGSYYGVIGSTFMPSPVEVARALYDLAKSGEMGQHIGASLQRLILGWLIGVGGGIVLGLAIGLFSVARAAGIPVVSALFPIPKIALLPLFIVWFGIGEPSKVATIAFGTFFPTVISTYGGVDGVDRTLIRMGQSFGLSWWSIVRKIVLPGALPAMLSGFRISASIGIILLVAAEMIGAEYGIGAYILLAGNLFATDQLIAGVVLLSVLGLIVAWAIGRAEKWLLRWR